MARPLTKKKSDGTLYKRPDGVEAAIDQALHEDLETLTRRAKISSRALSGFLPLECLVHLIREACRGGDEAAAGTLLPILLGRCEAILNAKITTSDLPSAEEVREQILGDFSVLFAEDAAGGGSVNTLDFFECRFFCAFRTFRLPYIERERQRVEPLISRPETPESSDQLTDDEFLSQLSAECSTPANQDTHVLRNALFRAIDSLPLDQCKAVMLRYFYELPEESENPSVMSVASVCGVTGRTVRYRLQRALATLSKQFNQRGRTRHELEQRSGTSQ
jgi:hypothetical protein